MNTMLPLKQRLTDLENLLELYYEKLAEHEHELSMTASPNVRNEAKQRIKREIMPSIRKHEAEYWALLRQFANASDIAELESQTAIATIVQDAKIIQTKPMPNEVLQKLQEILDKLNEPGTAAAAKAKFAVNVIPGILAYEFELDTENSLRQLFQPLKQLFSASAKKA
jgi:phosphoenolpyruvate carboxylase